MGSHRDNSSRNRKRKQEKREKRKQRGGARRGPVSWKERMERAGRWPLLECRVTDGLDESRHAHVLIAREGPASIAVVVFEVDLGCLGVKGCFRGDDFTLEQYDDLVDELSRDVGLEPCEPAFAVKLVQAAVRYASDLGFRPHPDYEAGRAIFGDVDPAACSEQIEFGDDGRPLYVALPDDDSAEIVRRLLEHRGLDGFALLLTRAELGSDLGGPAPPDEDPSPERRAWTRVQGAATAAADAVLKLAVARGGEELLLAARDEFTREAPKLVDDELIESTWFESWALFTWRDHGLGAGGAADPDARPLALELLAERGSELGELERRFIEAACARPFSFHTVESVESAGTRRGIGLRDLMTGESHFVLNDDISDQATPGAVLFARVVALEGVAVLVGFGDDPLPPIRTIHALDLREDLAGGDRYLTDEELHDHHDVLRAAYWRAVGVTRIPRPAQLENTDGEPLVEHEVVFQLSCTPAEALEALRSLAFEWDDGDFEEETTRDARGAIQSVELPWLVPGNRLHPSWTNTVCAHLTIDGEELWVEANSEARAERIRAEIERRLGDRVVHLETLVQDPEDLPVMPSGGRSASDTTIPSTSSGGSRAVAAAMQREWPDQAIPILGGQTPREAVATPSGRERVEALLRELEWHDAQEGGEDDEPLMDVAALRRELGLTAR
jgi:hypothetical protein